EMLRIHLLEHETTDRAVGLPIDEGADDVAEARQSPEVHRVVSVERCVIAQPAVGRVRVLVELPGERVQLHADGSRTDTGRSGRTTHGGRETAAGQWRPARRRAVSQRPGRPSRIAITSVTR